MRRTFLLALGLIAVAVAALGAAADAWLAQLHQAHEARIAETLAGVQALLDEAQQSLSRDAALLARDMVVVQGGARNEWFMDSSGLGPQRIVVFAAGRGARLMAIINPAGGPVAYQPGTTIPKIAPPEKPAGMLGVSDHHAYLLGVARFAGLRPSGEAVPGAFGLVVLGRELESLVPRLARMPSRPALVALAGDRAVASTLPEAPVTGWEPATRAGFIAITGDPWALRLLRGFRGGSLWLLVPEKAQRGERGRLRSRTGVSLSVVAGAVAGAVWLSVRRRR